jgi:hypothetical protein
MTFSLLARDEKTGALVAAAATGSLCVGGWVIRGALGCGIGRLAGDRARRRFWRDEVAGGLGRTVRRRRRRSRRITSADAKPGAQAAWPRSTPPDGPGPSPGESVRARYAGSEENRMFVPGTCCRTPTSSPRCVEGWDGRRRPGGAGAGGVARGRTAGGDARGLTSAALLVLRPDAPPLDLRIDLSATPLDDLERLFTAARHTALCRLAGRRAGGRSTRSARRWTGRKPLRMP